MDANGDGDVSQNEFVGPIDVFDRIDTDSDGFLSRDEVSGALK